MKLQTLFLCALFVASPLCAMAKDDCDTVETVRGQGVVVMDFYADWCGPCKKMHKVIEQLIREFPRVSFTKVNVDLMRNVASQYNVVSLPTLVIVKNGAEVARRTGLKSYSELAGLIRSVL